jgi:hypothetical protein
MKRLMAFFAFLALVISMGTGAVAHAVEALACVDIVESVSSLGHMAGDGDQVPADAEKGYPHHHGGCSGHGVAEPAAEPRIVTPFGSVSSPLAERSEGLTPRTVATLLRPPQA